MHFDLLIRNGRVVDGSGKKPAFRADVGIIGDRIAAVDIIEGATADTIVDAGGKLVSPGFIDVHVHSEAVLIGGEGDRYGALKQGVTTHLLAPDGFGWAQLPPEKARELWEYTSFAYGKMDLSFDWPKPEDYLALFDGTTPANVAPQAPHCAIRMAVMGWEARHATPEELDRMRELVRQWMEAGAVGLCLGLDYQPSASSNTHELIELCKVVREYGGVYAAHIRKQELGTAGAWRETMRIGAEAGIPVHISHEFANDVTEPLLAEAESICDLTFESYMYMAGSTHMALMLPIWAQAGGPRAMMERVRDPKVRPRIEAELNEILRGRFGVGGDGVFSATQTGRYIGKRLSELARASGLSVGAFALRILEEEQPYALMIFHHGGTPEQHADIVRRTIRHPRMMVASDGIYHGPLPHPRGHGCFARALRLCVREMQAVSWEEAIYKMSGFPAERFGLADRGLLCKGYGADVVVFDPETVADRATWEEPRLDPVGIDCVVVNGRIVVQNGRPTGERPGRVLRRGRG